MTDRDRLIEIMARAICYTWQSRDVYGSPPSDQHMRDLYGDNWPAMFLDDAEAVLAATERAGFRIVPPVDGR